MRQKIKICDPKQRREYREEKWKHEAGELELYKKMIQEINEANQEERSQK